MPSRLLLPLALSSNQAFCTVLFMIRHDFTNVTENGCTLHLWGQRHGGIELTEDCYNALFLQYAGYFCTFLSMTRFEKWFTPFIDALLMRDSLPELHVVLDHEDVNAVLLANIGTKPVESMLVCSSQSSRTFKRLDNLNIKKLMVAHFDEPFYEDLFTYYKPNMDVLQSLVVDCEVQVDAMFTMLQKYKLDSIQFFVVLLESTQPSMPMEDTLMDLIKIKNKICNAAFGYGGSEVLVRCILESSKEFPIDEVFQQCVQMLTPEFTVYAEDSKVMCFYEVFDNGKWLSVHATYFSQLVDF
uniref:F-box domain-containing protein n=1 Tax=Panagrellus redivivus TaxID=6233 RepID=A0A7E4WDP7_PANRE